MTIKIPVSADFDAGQVEQQLQQFRQQLNSLGQQIAQTNKVQFNPVGKSTIDDMRKVAAQFETLKRVSGDLNRRLKSTGQGGAGFFDVDWAKLYPDTGSRHRQMSKAFQYVTGMGFHSPIPPAGGAQGGGQGGGRPNSPPTRAPDPPTRRPGGGVVQQVAGAGLRAFGPVGGVAANSMSTGMSMGMGAGLMGLLGGLGALGIGKAVGAVTQKMGQAEENAVAYDRLKRALGDVNVSFDALKSVVEGAAGNVKITFDEAGRLGSQFAKLGNLTADQYKSLSGELQTGVGLSRAYGLDPSQGVGVMGTMRGMRLTNNEQDSRKFALVIGETIARSNAFAKADEVMDALAGYATTQTRSSMGANVAGYSGTFSALAGSGIGGLDPAGTAGLLARVNSSLAAGGAHGEASQFFTQSIGARHGLDPFQMQMWREGGAFATLDSTFGPGSMASRFGMSGPSGGQTYLSESLNELRNKYGKNNGMLANATANHLGVNMHQAMALLSVNPNQTGEMEQRLGKLGVKLTDLNAGGIGNLSKVMYGSDADRAGIARSLHGRTGAGALSADEQRKLSDVMANGSASDQKDLLTQLVATRDQEQTQGKDIRDSKTSLENIATSLADRLIPLTQEMRHGIMYIAGKGEMSATDIQEQVLRGDSKGRTQAIDGKYKALIDEQGTRIFDARMSEDQSDYSTIENSRRIQAEANAEIARLKQEQARLIEDENEELESRVRDMRREAESSIVPSAGSGSGSGSSGGPARPAASGGGGHAGVDPALRALVSGYEREIGAPEGMLLAQMQQESGFNPGAVSGAGAQGLAQVLPSTRRSLERRFGRKFDPFDPKDSAFMQKELMRENKQKFGNWDDAMRAYNGGWDRSRWGNAETSNYVPSIRGIMGRNGGQGTPMPDDASNRGKDQRFIFDTAPLEIIHKNEAGLHIRPPQMLATTIRPAAPFGTERFG